MRVKFSVTVYPPAPDASAPPATVCAAVDSVNDDPQEPVPPVPETLAEAHATLTADTGMVVQVGNADVEVASWSAQFDAVAPFRTCQLTVATAVAMTIPVSGSVALKLMVDGLALAPEIFAATELGAAAILVFELG